MTLTVGALRGYPVKTVAGERVDTAEITTNGIISEHRKDLRHRRAPRRITRARGARRDPGALAPRLLGNGKCSGDIEVVEESNRDLVLRDVTVTWLRAVAPQALEVASGLLEPSLVELPSFAPWSRQDQQPQRARRVSVEHVVHVHEIAGGLGHLLAVDEHAADVHPCPCEGSHSGEGLGLSRFVGMMREGEIFPTDVKVDRRAKRRQRHGRALGVPTRPPGTPGARPRRFTAGGSLPQRRVEWIILVRIVGVTAALAHKFHRAGSVQSNSRRDIGATEVHRAVALVRRAVREEMGHERDDLVHIVTAAGLIGRSDDSELRHVALEPVGLLDGQRSPRHAVALRLDEDVVVDVGHVAAHLDGRPRQSENPGGDVGPHERGRVPDVGRLVRGDTAHVHPRAPENRERRVADPKRGGRAEPGMGGHRLGRGGGAGWRHRRCRF